jgi:hypothetical protein
MKTKVTKKPKIEKKKNTQNANPIAFTHIVNGQNVTWMRAGKNDY